MALSIFSTSFEYASSRIFWTIFDAAFHPQLVSDRTFRALSKTYGQMWLRCDVCRRYARLKLAGLLPDQDLQVKGSSEL